MSVFIWSHESENISVTSMYAVYMYSHIYHGHCRTFTQEMIASTPIPDAIITILFTPQTDQCLNSIPREKKHEATMGCV